MSSLFVSSPLASLVRYGTFTLGLGYGVCHFGMKKPAASQHVSHHDAHATAAAVQEHASTAHSSGPAVDEEIYNPDSPKFDLEKLLEKVALQK